MKIRNFFISIFHAGITADMNPYSAFIIKGINAAAVFGLFGSILSFPVDDLYKNVDVGFPVISCIIIFSSIIFFNKTHKFIISKFLIFGLFPLVQFINVTYIEPENTAIVFTIFPVIFGALLGIKNKFFRILTCLYLVLLCFFPLKDILNVLGVPFYFNLLLALIVMILGMQMILNYFQQNDKRLTQQNNILQIQNKKLQSLVEQNDHKTELLSILSHNLKGPANSFNELSKKVAFLIKNERFDELQEYGEYFEQSGSKIFNNIDRLLTWSISQKKNIIASDDNFSPFEMIDQINNKLELLNNEKTIYFHNNIPKDLLVTTDARILEIILQNLLSNAVNNSPNKESIVISSEASQSDFITSITNQGPMIDMDIVKLAKEGKFKRSRDGHGLGLGICFSLIKFLKGQIIYESNNFAGTTVKVSIPNHNNLQF